MLNDESLDKAENSILPKNVQPGSLEEFEQYLNMTADQVRRLDAEEVAIISLRLNQYSFYIQRCSNRERSRVIYLRHQLKEKAAKNYSKYDGSWEYREQQAILGNPEAQKISDLLTYHESRLARIENLSLSIKNISDNFRNIQYDKRRTEKIPD